MNTFCNISSVKAATSLSTADIIATASMITAVLSLGVAFIALVAAILQTYFTKRHNMLSIKPLIEVNAYKKRDDPVAITLINHGLGTAIVKHVSLVYNNKTYHIVSHKGVDLFINEMDLHRIPGDAIEISTVIPPSNLGANCEMPLLKFCNSTDDDNKFKLYSELSDKIDVIVKYNCLYDKEYTSCRFS